MRRLAAIVLWSVLAAAFIGPGTVTTAASAGAGFGFALLWALGFSIVACWVLQEAAARLTIAGGETLAEALARRYPRGARRWGLLGLVIGAVIVGCAAYEAGNILGAVAGIELIDGWTRGRSTLLLGGVAALLLWFNSPRRVAQSLALLVAVMGTAFLYSAWELAPDGRELASALFRPTLPAGSTVLALGLVGTTVVPYNLFLGSGLARGGRLAETRFGIAIAVLLGGVISMAVLVTGSALSGPFSFAELAGVLEARLGTLASPLLGWGLLAAGLSSAVTAPLAAAITARGLFAGDDAAAAWSSNGWKYRAVWVTVLGVGVGFGLSEVRPVPVILLAQALNGVLLPLIAGFLFVAVNDRRQLGERAVNGWVANTLTAAVVGVSLLLGVRGLLGAGAAAIGSPAPQPSTTLAIAALAAVIAGAAIGRAVVLARRW